MTDSKYSVPGNYWERYDAPDEVETPTHVSGHTIEVILTTDPNDSMGYGREKWSVTITHPSEDDDEDNPTVLYAVKSRWKGNYWREQSRYDWMEIPKSVRHQVAAVVRCESVSSLDPGVRLVDEGGEELRA